MLVKFIYESYTLHAVLQCHEPVPGGGVFSPTQAMWYHPSQPSHCIMLSRHSDISQVQNTCLYFLVWNGGTRARHCECEIESVVKHPAKCWCILSCSNSISSKLSPLAARKHMQLHILHSLQHPVSVEDLEHVPGYVGLPPHHLLLSKSSACIWWLADTAKKWKASQRTCCRITCSGDGEASIVANCTSWPGLQSSTRHSLNP